METIVEIERQKYGEGWRVGTPTMDEFEGVSSQLTAIILGWADPVES